MPAPPRPVPREPSGGDRCGRLRPPGWRRMAEAYRLLRFVQKSLEAGEYAVARERVRMVAALIDRLEAERLSSAPAHAGQRMRVPPGKGEPA